MKNIIEVPCCYFPTTVYFVDDEPAFLKSLTFTLQRNLSYQFFHDSREMIKSFSQSHRPNRFFDPVIANLFDGTFEGAELTDHPVNINILQLHQAIYDKTRFSDVAVIVVDYAMPGMNGLQLAKLVKDADPKVKIVMLTGQADLNLAIQAFNNRDIDQFILKDNQNFNESLNKSIAELQRQYFTEQSVGVLSALCSDKNHCLLSNHLFERFFGRFCSDHHIQEYYLVDDIGSFLLLNTQGEASWLVVRNQQAIQDCCDLLNDVALSDMARMLQAKEKIPFLLTDEQLRLPATQWEPFLYPAKSIPGLFGYYYAYVNDEGRYGLNTIFPYQDYLLVDARWEK